MKQKITDGIYVVHPRKSRDGRLFIRSASIILYHGRTGAIVETPEPVPDQTWPWVDVASVVDSLRIKPESLLFSHNHWDHTAGFWHFRKRFPDMRAVWHESFFGDSFWDFFREYVFQPGDTVFSTPSQILHLDGEPLLLLHAPKHSLQDVLIFFKGAVITGDWTLGPMPDCNDYVLPWRKVMTLKAVKKFLLDKRYHVHTVISAHGDDIRQNIDFPSMLDEMIEYWDKF